MEGPVYALLNRRQLCRFRTLPKPPPLLSSLLPLFFARVVSHSIHCFRLERNKRTTISSQLSLNVSLIQSLSTFILSGFGDFLGQSKDISYPESFFQTLVSLLGRAHCIFGPYWGAMILNQDPTNYHIQCVQHPHYPICTGQWGNAATNPNLDSMAVTVLSLCRPYYLFS